MRRLRPVILLVLCVLTLTAAREASAFDVRILLATLALGMLGFLAKYAWERDRALVRFEERTDAALWGPADPSGRRDPGAGLVGKTTRIAEGMPQVIAAAQLAAEKAEVAAQKAEMAAAYSTVAGDAAREAQQILRERESGR